MTEQEMIARREAATHAAWQAIYGDGDPFQNPEAYDFCRTVADAILTTLEASRTPVSEERRVRCSKCGEPNMMLCDCSLPSRIEGAASHPPVSEGMVLVPREPTEAMRIAALTHRLGRGPLYEEIWKAMLSASPQPKEG